MFYQILQISSQFFRPWSITEFPSQGAAEVKLESCEHTFPDIISLLNGPKMLLHLFIYLFMSFIAKLLHCMTLCPRCEGGERENDQQSAKSTQP